MRSTSIDHDAAERALTAAAQSASRAPSIHNTQPWHWRIHGNAADLYAVPERSLPISDPERRMLLTSCGTALHHACVALGAEGLDYDVIRIPDPDNPDHLARITVTGHSGVMPAAMRLFQATEIRRTDRRPLLDERIGAGILDVLRAAVTQFGVGIDPLDNDQTITLAGAIDLAQRDQIGEARARAELREWTARDDGLGIPEADLPESAPPTTVPVRDFARHGTLGVPQRHDAAATYAILYGLEDDPTSWLRAGEALSALWLTATEHNVAVMPLSVAVEEPSTRLILRRLLSGIGYPYLAVRLGIADPQLPPPDRTPRLPASATVEVTGPPDRQPTDHPEEER